LEPLDFIARLAVLVPKPRVHLTRYDGVLASHSTWRGGITPAGRGTTVGRPERPSAERHRALRWAQRLKRVFGIEIERCERCGGAVKIIASIEDAAVAGRILAQLEQRASAANGVIPTPPTRGAPGQGELALG
jgi:hypothetical protein